MINVTLRFVLFVGLLLKKMDKLAKIVILFQDKNVPCVHLQLQPVGHKIQGDKRFVKVVGINIAIHVLWKNAYATHTYELTKY